MTRSFAVLAAAFLLTACPGPTPPGGDGGTTVTDSGTSVEDSGTTVTDAGETVDSGTTVTDAGETPDGGTTDAGETDAGTTDAGTTDAGTTDAGTTDAGTTDAGTPCAATCAAQGKVCEPSSMTCVECLLDTHCPPAKPQCNGSHACVAAALNDSCAAPRALTFVSDVATATGDTSGAANDNAAGDPAPSCSNTAKSTGKDLVYQFTLAETRTLTVTVTPTGASPTFQPAVYLRRPSACASTTLADELACKAGGSPTPQSFTLFNLTAGTYSLWVDGSGGTAGTFQLEVSLAPKLNDDCSAAQALSFSGNTATVTGDTSNASNGNGAADASPTCSSSARSSGKDLVYSLTLTQPQDVKVTVTPTAGSPSFIPVAYLRAAGKCASGASADELACKAGILPGPISFTALRQPAGTHFLWVDGSGTSGAFTLTVELLPATVPPQNDLCADAEPLAFTGGLAVAQGDLSLATNGNPSTAAPTCSFSAASSGKDVVYSLTLASTQDVAVAVIPFSSSFTPVVYVRKPGACASELAADQLGCFAGTAARTVGLSLRAVPAGTYFLHVDSASGAGPFELRVRTSAAAQPAHDTCTAPQTLTLSSGTASATGTTMGATNGSGSVLPVCSPTARSVGQDVVYQLVLASAKELTVKVTPQGPSPTLLPVVSVRGPNVCDGTTSGDELGCSAPAAIASAQVTLDAQAGTYFLHVDSEYGSSGPFLLEVTAVDAPPPPTNDSCAAPTALTFTGDVATVSGSTRWASNSNVSADPSPTCSSGARTVGKDVVYSFTLAAPSAVAIKATAAASSSTFHPAVYLRKPGACASTALADELGCNAPGSATASLYLPQLAAGTYFVFVDGREAVGGDFQLEVKRITPPANDTCSSPTSISLGVPVNGSTFGATNDFQNGNLSAQCALVATFGTSPDVVYAFVAPSNGTFKATVNGTFDTVLYLLNPTCSAASCISGADIVESGEELSFTATAGQNYFIVVDGYGNGEMGDFTLKVQ